MSTPLPPPVNRVMREGGPAFTSMTIRDYFAGQALAGMLAYSHVNPQCGNFVENCKLEDAAGVAYQYADAMLAAREAKGGAS